MQVFKKKSGLIGFFMMLGLLLFFSCHKKLDWNPPEFEQKPVVNGVIKSGSPITIKVSEAVKFTAEPTPEAHNAEVLLYVNNEYAETLEHIGEGFYQSQLTAQEGSEYRCEVTMPGYPTATCSTRVPNHQNIVKFEHINKAGVDEEGLTYPAVKVTFDNLPDTSVYYELVIRLFEHEDYGSRTSPYNIGDPVLLNEGLPIAVFSNELIEGSTYTMTINYSTGSASNHNNMGWVTNLYPVQVELRTVSHSYYKFIKQQYLYELANSEPLLSVGVTGSYNLYSNVHNGYGILTGYSLVKSDIIDPNN
ncbi:MAG: DUF4249 domain-containing protein [Bacteroidales bacterium]|nr:DUF4249 domain-containing protein [Bacteroidales bacterium]MDD4673401.1 DUF4249 domain-containing protein [Bacteroidales bacterium]